MAAAPACVHSSMKILPLVLVAVAAVLSVPGKATSAQGDPLRGSAFRDYRGDNVENEDNVPASQLHSILPIVCGLHVLVPAVRTTFVCFVSSHSLQVKRP
ncbi:uncharacterized protein LOC110835669 isoform X4 [Zootermopsis nevadensis]|uniref:uncharacterized protein LOC110835669 isoform X4 n=1 Tax=Zootermopsis nevadensis TaxID=136037 RepID=UPI000B8EA5F7|nr:uncharacterized protein LOC110835669 isoform X4 [Zootermopsis nevadensis]